MIMLFLFYLNKQNNQDGIKKFTEFLLGFSVHTNMNILILCESGIDNEMLTNTLSEFKNKKIINIYEGSDDGASVDHKDIELSFNNYLYNVEPGRFKDIREVQLQEKLLRKHFNSILTKYGVEFVHFGFNYGVFRSVGIVILQQILHEKGIPLYMVFSTPIKGRYTVYEDIYFKNNKFENEYNHLIQKGFCVKTLQKLDHYFKTYVEFKKAVHIPLMLKRQKYKLRQFLSVFLLYFYKIIIGRSNGTIRSTIRNPERPYILYLLSKANHWYSSYANPELLDRQNIIRNLWLNLPYGYDLVVKSHPHVSLDEDMEKIIFRLPACFLYYDAPSTDELVRDAEIIVNSGSTAGVEALMQKNHVIELGKKPPYFNFKNPPVKKVEHLSDLKEAIKECLNEAPPEDKINAYFIALLQNSIPLNGIEDVISFVRKKDMYKEMGQVLAEVMEEHTVVGRNSLS